MITTCISAGSKQGVWQDVIWAVTLPFFFLRKDIPPKLWMLIFSITNVRPGLSLKKGHHCKRQIGVDPAPGFKLGVGGLTGIDGTRCFIF